MEHVYTIKGMHCESCVEKIACALRNVNGVTSVRVSLNPPEARVVVENHVPFAELQNAVHNAGKYTLHAADERTAMTATGDQAKGDVSKESLYPLVLILGYLVGIVFLFAWLHRDFSHAFLMTRFMGGFFVVFSFFKLLDLLGFADAFRSYDVVAGAVPTWGFVYPFVELGLGVAYLASWNLVVTNMITLVVMLVGSVGVFHALLRKRAIRCACLGTVLNLPMTKITLVEDVGMAAMAALGLLMS
ncbi:MAG: cation transporter [Planctomycetes bacterium]|nr:cation transporter [Planctomycetota bacterium]MBI3833411.1 cation transporter [Planctomycetota bacterium]